MFTTSLTMKSWFRAVAAALPDEGTILAYLRVLAINIPSSIGPNCCWNFDFGLLSLHWLLPTPSPDDRCFEMDFVHQRQSFLLTH